METIHSTKIEGIYIHERTLYPDERGFFQEIYRTEPLEDRLNREINVIQGNLSLSVPNTVRGLHAEYMDKLITPLNGKVFVAFADLREESETFGEVVHFKVDNTDPYTPRRTFFLPDGIANSFCNYGDTDIMYLYGVSENYDGRPKRTIIYNDADLAIPWPIDLDKAITSELDQKNPTMRETFPHRFPRERNAHYFFLPETMAINATKVLE